MYQALLTRRYLTSKVMPLLAAVAVMLCVATEIIVWSVMGGFLQMLIESGRTLIGDVAITRAHVGYPHYDDLISRLEKDPLVAAATPVIETYGLLSLPGGRVETVLVKGVDGAGYDRVTQYRDALWWHPLETPLPKDYKREDPRVDPNYKDRLAEAFRDGLRLESKDPTTGLVRPAIVPGIEVSRFNRRQPGGWVIPAPFLPGMDVKLIVMPLDRTGRNFDVVAKGFPVANEYRSGLYEIDANTVIAPLAELQRMLKMNEARRIQPTPGAFEMKIDPATGKEAPVVPEVIGVDPARVTSVLVRGKDKAQAAALRDRCEQIYQDFAADHADVPPPDAVDILTWRERNATLINAVETETGLVMFIFGIISLTSVFLVLAIFWSMVSEKTKDIGVLRSLGASRSGVAWLWLRYGLAIGLVGSVLGGAAAFAIVHNINPIHEWIGRTTGHYVWNPEVYYFTTIPNRVNPLDAAMVLAGGALASLAGALIPALKAANMDPVRALRFE